MPALLNHEELEKNGVPGLLSREGFRIAYTDYQQHMVDELNESTAGMPSPSIYTSEDSVADAIRTVQAQRMRTRNQSHS